jgi:hypothetical protein
VVTAPLTDCSSPAVERCIGELMATGFPIDTGLNDLGLCTSLALREPVSAAVRRTPKASCPRCAMAARGHEAPAAEWARKNDNQMADALALIELRMNH